MLGRLAENFHHYPNLGEDQDCVTPMRNSNRILFYVIPHSPDPEQIVEMNFERHEPLYIGFDEQDVFPHGFFRVEYSYLKAYDKVQYIKDRLKDKLILFQPILKPGTKQPNMIHKNLRVIALEEPIGEITENSYFIPVPQVHISHYDFEDKIRNKEKVVFADYNHQMAAPEYVVCNDYLYISEKGWIADPSLSTAWVQSNPDKIRKIRLPEDYNSQVVSEVNKNLLFFDNDYLIQLTKKANEYIRVDFEDNARLLLNDDEVPNDKSKANSTSSSFSVTYTSEQQRSRFNIEELLFLSALQKRALQQTLIYSTEDLYNFHISVKTNALTILAGMSGTGKTELAMLYAQTLGLKKDEDLLVLSIDPSITEPGDILGYLNTGTNLYVPASTGLVDLLIRAERYPNQMHMVIFEEMNLSQVEHWFAPFISMLELKEGHRALSLYSEKTNPHNSEKYRPKIRIGNNILFVGTVNMDETTKDFSDRLLDRANIVILHKNKFLESKLRIEEAASRQNQDESDVTAVSEVFANTATYRSWIYTDETWTLLSDAELEFFDALHGILNDIDPQKGVSFRVLDRIAKYLNNIPQNAKGEPLLSRGDAIDFQVKQRIMTKIRGPIEQYEKVIGQLAQHDQDRPTDSALYELFTGDKAKKISPFTRTIREIRRKARELYLNGYAT